MVLERSDIPHGGPQLLLQDFQLHTHHPSYQNSRISFQQHYRVSFGYCSWCTWKLRGRWPVLQYQVVILPCSFVEISVERMVGMRFWKQRQQFVQWFASTYWYCITLITVNRVMKYFWDWGEWLFSIERSLKWLNWGLRWTFMRRVYIDKFLENSCLESWPLD